MGKKIEHYFVIRKESAEELTKEVMSFVNDYGHELVGEVKRDPWYYQGTPCYYQCVVKYKAEADV